MSSFIKLPVSSRINNYLRLSLLEGVTTEPTESLLGLQLKGGIVTSLSGEDAGEPLFGPVKANKRIRISLGEIKPFKFHVSTQENYKLAEYGNVWAPRMIEPLDSVNLYLILETKRAFDISELEWTIRLYLRE